ncbi:MAG: carbohydrate ABC transporter permease, partial [Planctomycetes bacterium]|nr:carbohydrate ABC transporter permease [Planctomycetota bacterium]
MSRAWRNLGLGIIIAVIIIALTPYVWMFLTSIKTRVDALASVPKWLFSPTLEHYPKVFLDKDYLPLVGNSIVVALSSTLLSLLVGVPASYVFARER